ncbi:glycosyltransferase family 4 protein [Halogeometricum borinquense]|uniref:Glycosyltransferase family 4 protein n=1 Tax=Halogeometricum borinquense TaxID=60847 RepID=A0A6C0UJ00_9EURY|nr:glycosyltransferase family 1 protein [Halogeometricum borinquense]QIB75514.1 glycosyltransferase family 4 protein [Halogeometricum borinquense]
MKVGVNARTFSVDEPGGAVQASINHTKGLIKRSDTDVVLFGHESISSLFPEATIESSFYPTPSQGYGLLWERIILPQQTSKHDVDVLFCPNGNAPVTEIECPVVMCIHDVNAAKGWSSGVHQMYRRVAVPHGAKKADTIVTVSQFSKSEITNHLDIPAEKIEVVYNGINQLYLSEDSGTSLELPDDYILFVGSMNPRKNIRRVIESFVKLKKGPDITHKLVIIGPNNKTIFKNVDIAERDDIVTPGFVTEQELKYAYKNASVFVFPSLYEGFGLPPLEALASGTPVVASNTTSLGEILNKGSLLVNPKESDEIASAILQVLEDETLRSKLKAEGKELAAEYTWEKASQQLYAVLNNPK